MSLNLALVPDYGTSCIEIHGRWWRATVRPYISMLHDFWWRNLFQKLTTLQRVGKLQIYSKWLTGLIILGANRAGPTDFHWWDGTSTHLNSSVSRGPNNISLKKNKKQSGSPTFWSVSLHYLEAFLHHKSHSGDIIGFSMHLILASVKLCHHSLPQNRFWWPFSFKFLIVEQDS